MKRLYGTPDTHVVIHATGKEQLGFLPSLPGTLTVTFRVQRVFVVILVIQTILVNGFARVSTTVEACWRK